MEEKADLYTLVVSVWDPSRLLYRGDAESITSYNDKGLFDVLPIHENFITIIKDMVVVRAKDGQNLEYPVLKGILKVEENAVDVFLGTEEV